MIQGGAMWALPSETQVTGYISAQRSMHYKEEMVYYIPTLHWQATQGAKYIKNPHA